jgi:hypothetical protein
VVVDRGREAVRDRCELVGACAGWKLHVCSGRSEVTFVALFTAEMAE